MMERVRFIPGIQWAADIMTGQKPIPFANPKRQQESEKGDFQSVLDREMERLEAEHE